MERLPFTDLSIAVFESRDSLVVASAVVSARSSSENFSEEMQGGENQTNRIHDDFKEDEGFIVPD